MPDFNASKPVYVKEGKYAEKHVKGATLLAPVGGIVTEADQRLYGIPHPDGAALSDSTPAAPAPAATGDAARRAPVRLPTRRRARAADHTDAFPIVGRYRFLDGIPPYLRPRDEG